MRRQAKDPHLRKTIEYLRSPVFQSHVQELNQIRDFNYVLEKLDMGDAWNMFMNLLSNMNGQSQVGHYTPPERPIPMSSMMSLVDDILSIINRDELQNVYSSHKVKKFLGELGSKDVKEALRRLNDDHMCKGVMERFKYHGFDPRTIMTKFYLFVMKVVKE